MKLYKAFLVTTLALSVIACKKETSSERQTSHNLEDVDFDYVSEKTIDYSLSLSSENIAGLHKVNFFKEWTPKGGEKLVCSRLVSVDKGYDGEIVIPSYLDKIYVEVTTSHGSSYMEVVELGSKSSFQASLGEFKFNISRKATMISPDCNTGCTTSYTNHNSNLTINTNNEVICITNGLGDKHLTVQGTGNEVRLCGVGALKNVNINAGNTLIIVDGAQITFSSLDVKLGADMYVYNADVIINQGNWTLNGQMTNNGDIQVNGNGVVNGNGDLTNNGEINATGNFHNNSLLANFGKIHADGHIHFNGSSKTTNYCLITTDDHLHVNDSLWNHGYIGAVKDIHFNGGSYTEMISGAMIEGDEDAVVNSKINGTGITSLLKVANNTNVNGSGVIEGNVELCTGTSNVTGTITAPAALGCNTVIVATPCNKGTRTQSCTDSDGDGVCDPIDCRPNDPTIAVCDCYPSCEEYATLAYEDLWPYEGDYDFNDLVINYNYVYYANANNEVVSMDPSFLIRAIGASFKNGFGFQFDIAPSDVTSVSGQIMTQGILNFNPNGTESDQNKAVIMVFDNSNTAFSAGGTTGMTNTLPSLAYKEPDTIFMSIAFASPQTYSALGEAPYNPFIFVKQDRSHEVHLMNHEPTDEMDMSLLGRGVDKSDPGNGIYFKAGNGLPWALNIPVEFDYPAEYNDTRDAYLHFVDWASSNGVLYADWYLDSPGYRNAALIY